MVMKKFTVVTFGVVVAAYSQFNIAGSITDTYSTGDTLSAPMLDNIKAAVNDNDTSKQDRVTGACGTGQFMFAVNPDGSVACDSDSGGDITGVTAGAGLEGGGTSGEVTISLPLGEINIHGSEFRVPETVTGCAQFISRSGMFWTAGTDCTALAALHFPRGSTINNIACSVFDEDSTDFIVVTLFRTNFSTAQSIFVVGTQTSVDRTGTQVLFNSVAANHAVDNANNFYYLEAAVFGDATKLNTGIVGCKIDYTP